MEKQLKNHLQTQLNEVLSELEKNINIDKINYLLERKETIFEIAQENKIFLKV